MPPRSAKRDCTCRLDLSEARPDNKELPYTAARQPLDTVNSLIPLNSLDFFKIRQPSCPTASYSFRGKIKIEMTDSERFAKIVVMRHSIRLDRDIDAGWEDKDSRPYDSPIRCFELPKLQGVKLSKHGITKIVCSPFRRCIQTAAIVGKEIGISELSIDLNFGEQMEQVRRANQARGAVDAEMSLTYLTEPQMLSTIRDLNPDMRISCITGSTPQYDESLIGSYTRFSRNFDRLQLEFPGDVLLVVTHGGCVDAVAQAKGFTAFEVCECGFIAVDDDGEILDLDGVQLLKGML